jgi:hypothetical protein
MQELGFRFQFRVGHIIDVCSNKGTQGETTDDTFYFMILSHSYPPMAAKTL